MREIENRNPNRLPRGTFGFGFDAEQRVVGGNVEGVAVSVPEGAIGGGAAREDRPEVFAGRTDDQYPPGTGSPKVAVCVHFQAIETSLSLRFRNERCPIKEYMLRTDGAV